MAAFDIPPLFAPLSLTPNKSCLNCAHRHRDSVSCDAYPDGIPYDIMSGETAHDVPIAGDHGIQWEPDPTAPLGLPDGWTMVDALRILKGA